MMKITKEQVARNRECLLEAAARLFRERGFDGVSVAEITRAAGLTHGVFYGHFASKDDLIAKAFETVLAQELSNSTAFKGDLAGYAEGYLSTLHRDNPGASCLYATLGTEAVRGPAPVRHALTEGLRRRLDLFTGEAAASERRQVVAGYAAIVGALLLSRIVDDPDLSQEILEQTRLALNKEQTGAP
jgi:TetR/AcrR family transcriptional repressor of nem operon